MGFFSFGRRIDDQGQPPPAFRRDARIDRDITEMLGLVKGVLADGTVSEVEAQLLQDWAKAHPDVAHHWPGNRLVERIEKIFRDSRVTADEREDLHSLLQEMVGGEAGVLVGSSTSTQLPLNNPQPTVEFEGRVFVLTGRFAYAPRKACEEEVIRRGGKPEARITQSTNYLVIGTFGSRDWIQSSHGRKIEAAVVLRDQKKLDLAIISEDHWSTQLS